MMPWIRPVALAVLAVMVVACGEDRSASPSESPAPAPAESAPAPEPAEPASDAVMSDTETPAETEEVTGFHGFGPAKFGDDEESVRISWGRPMEFDRIATEAAPCTYLRPDPAPSDEFAIAFMFENGRFVRYDVAGSQYEAPGSGRIGNTLEALESLYAGRYTHQPHKYIEGGKNLIVDGPAGSDAKLIFEIGADGMVTAWRIGVPPQVDYVEGCG